MKAPAMIGVAVLAVATVVVTAAAGGSRGVRLPLPQTALVGHPSPAGAAHPSTGSVAGTPPTTAGPSTGSTDSGANQPVIYATSPPAVLTGCTVSVSNPAPLRGQTAETATVTTTAGAAVRLEADYVKTRSVHDGLADGSGNASFALAIGHAQPGFTVRVTATVSLRGVKSACSTSFTPVDPAGTVPATVGGP
jgi:hypothetical protein